MRHSTRLSRMWLFLLTAIFSSALATASSNNPASSGSPTGTEVTTITGSSGVMTLDPTSTMGLRQLSTYTTDEVGTPPIAVCNSFTTPADNNCQALVFAQAFNGGSTDPDGSIVSQSISPSGPFAVGTHTVTYTVTDNSGLSSSCTATLTVTDQNGPTIVTANPTIALDANGQATISSSDVVSSAIDNCSGSNVNLSLSQSTFNCSDLASNIGNATGGTLSAVLTADNLFEAYISTDDNAQGTLFASGSNWAQTYTGSATLNPAQKYYIHVKAEDVGGPEFFAGKFTLTGGFQFANGTQSLNTNNADWQVSTTGWGNYGTPYLVGQAGQQLQIWGSGVNSLSPAYLIWSGDWNTNGGEIRYFTAEIQPIIPGTNVTVTGTDANGNVTNTTATVNLVDNTAPNVIANNITVTLDLNGNATISVADIDGGTTDNCGIDQISIDRTNFTCNDAGQTINVTLTASDLSGNVNSAVAAVTVQNSPSITAVNDVFSVNSGQSFTFSSADLIANDSDPLAQNLIVDAVLQPSSGTIVDNLDGTFTFTPAGTATQTATASYIVKRDDGTLVFADNGHFYEFVTHPGITWTQAKQDAEQMYYNGMQGYLVTVTSAAENTFVSQKLQGQGWMGANDAAAEGIWRWTTGPEAGTQFYEVIPGFFGTGRRGPVNNQYNNWSGAEPNNLGDEDYAHFLTNGGWNDYPNSVGTLISGYIVEYGGMPNDCSTNQTAQGIITFNVQDATAPTAVAKNITVPLSASGVATITAADVNNGSTDNVGITGISIDVSSFDCSNAGQTIPVTLTVTDAAGNTDDAVAQVTVVDNTPPTAVANNISIQLDVTGYATITASQIDAGSSDVCGSVTTSIDKTSFNCNDVGSPVAVTLTVLDAAGNPATATGMVTVLDVQPISAVDDAFNVNGGSPFTFSSADLVANDTDPYGQPLVVDAVVSPSTGTIVDNLDGTFTFTPATAANHTVTASYIVKRDDGTIVYSGNGHIYEFVSSAGISWTQAKQAAEQRTYNGMQGYLATVTSAAEDAFVAQKLQGEGWIGASDQETEGIWKWVTGPEAGTTFWERRYIYIAFGSGYWQQGPVNGEYNNWASGEPNNAGGVEDWAHYWTSGLWNDYPNQVSQISGYIVEYGGMSGDCNSNSSSTGGITFNVQDITPPTVLTKNVTLSLDANGQASLTAADVDNGSNDASGIASMSIDITSFDCSNIGSNTVTLTVVDNNGLSANGIAEVYVNDTTSPVLAVQNIDAYLDANGQVSISASDVDNGTTDNCALDTMTISQSTFTCDDLGPNNITFTASDMGGGPAGTYTRSGNLNINTGQGQRFFSADVDGDGDLDLSNGFEVYRNNGDGTSWNRQALGSFAQAGGAFADLDNDGDLDLVALDNVYLNDGNGFFTFYDQLNSNYPNFGLTGYGDFDEDGDIDLYQPHYYVNYGDRVLFNDGTGKFNGTDPAQYDQYGAYYSMAVVIADIDSDGHLDALVSGYNLTIRWGDGTGVFTSQSLTIPQGGYGRVNGVEDIDGDGDLDFVFRNGAAYAYTNNGGRSFSYAKVAGSDQFGGTTYAAYDQRAKDMNDDGLTDFVSVNADKMMVLYTKGDGTFTVEESVLPGNGGISAFDLGDFNTDGYTDVAINTFVFSCCAQAPIYFQDVASGNSASTTAVVTVKDTISPSATFAGGNFTLNSNRSVTLNANSLVSNIADNCGNVTAAIIGRDTYNCDDVGGTFPITVELTDGSGNTSRVSGTVAIVDVNSVCNTPPVAVCSSLNVAADPTCQAQVLAQAFNGGSYDAEDGTYLAQSIVPAGPFGLGIHTVTYTVTDSEGASNSCVTTITVTDQSGPVLTTQNITIPLDANGQATITPSDVVLSAFDNCSGSNVTLSLDNTQFDCNSVPAVNGTGGPGTIAATLTADNRFEYYISTDDNVQGTFIGSGANFTLPYSFTSNLAAGQTYYIHVKATDDGGPEMFLGKFNLTGGFEFGNGTQTLVTNAADWKVSPTGWNNYVAPLYLGNIGSGPWGSGLSSMSPAQYIWHGQYNTYSGETKYFSAPIYPTGTGDNVTITATDTYGNVTTESVIVNVIDNLAPIASVKNINVTLDASGNASITAADIDDNSSDNCGITSYSLDVSSFTCADAGTTVPVTMTVEDASGNSNSATAMVTVIDNTDPIVVTNSNIVVVLDANGQGSLTAADVDGGSNDACGILSTSIDVTSFSCADVGMVPVTLTVTDNNNNSASTTVNVSVVDNIDPIVLTNNNVVVSLDANGQGSLTAGDIDNGSNDACGIQSTSIDVTSFSCADVGTVPVTLTVTDNNGNIASATVNVTVVDNVDPVVVANSNVVVSLDANGQGSLTAGDIDNGSNDACGIQSTSIDVTSFSCADVGTVPVTLTVTDNNGNSASATINVTVVDNVDPVVVTNSNIIVNLDANGQGSLTAADVDGGSNDACGIQSTSIDVTSFSCADVGMVPVRLTVTDNNGNVASSTVNVSVEDNIAPTALCQNIIVDLPTNGPAVITASQIDNGSFDNCGVASVTVSPSSFDCDDEGANTVTLTVTDVNGNISTCTAKVTVVKQPIVVTSVLSDYNGYGVSCFDGSNGSIDISVSGACEPYSFDWSTGASSEDVSGLSAGTYTVEITDGNGEQYTYSYTITEPTRLVSGSAMNPYIAVAGQQDSTIFLGYGPQSTTLSVSPSGGVAPYSYSWSPASSLSATNTASVTASPSATTTYTCIITDANGCTVSKSITVQVIDARCGKNGNKVLICKIPPGNRGNPHTICVSPNAVMQHLTRGSYLGPCNNSAKVEPAASVFAETVDALLYPNPTASNSTLTVEVRRSQDVRIALFDFSGQQISMIHDEYMAEDVEYQFEINSSELAAGVYNVVIYTEEGTEALRWIVTR